MTDRKSNMQQKGNTETKVPFKNSENFREGGPGWDDPNGLGGKIWHRIHSGGILVRQIRKNVIRSQMGRMIGYSPLADFLLGRWNSNLYNTIGLSMPLVNYPFPFSMTGSIRHATMLTPKSPVHSPDSVVMPSFPIFRGDSSITMNGIPRKPGLLSPGAKFRNIDKGVNAFPSPVKNRIHFSRKIQTGQSKTASSATLDHDFKPYPDGSADARNIARPFRHPKKAKPMSASMTTRHLADIPITEVQTDSSPYAQETRRFLTLQSASSLLNILPTREHTEPGPETPDPGNTKDLHQTRHEMDGAGWKEESLLQIPHRLNRSIQQGIFHVYRSLLKSHGELPSKKKAIREADQTHHKPLIAKSGISEAFKGYRRPSTNIPGWQTLFYGQNIPEEEPVLSWPLLTTWPPPSSGPGTFSGKGDKGIPFFQKSIFPQEFPIPIAPLTIAGSIRPSGLPAVESKAVNPAIKPSILLSLDSQKLSGKIRFQQFEKPHGHTQPDMANSRYHRSNDSGGINPAGIPVSFQSKHSPVSNSHGIRSTGPTATVNASLPLSKTIFRMGMDKTEDKTGVTTHAVSQLVSKKSGLSPRKIISSPKTDANQDNRLIDRHLPFSDNKRSPGKPYIQNMTSLSFSEIIPAPGPGNTQSQDPIRGSMAKWSSKPFIAANLSSEKKIFDTGDGLTRNMTAKSNSLDSLEMTARGKVPVDYLQNSLPAKSQLQRMPLSQKIGSSQYNQEPGPRSHLFREKNPHYSGEQNPNHKSFFQTIPQYTTVGRVQDQTGKSDVNAYPNSLNRALIAKSPNRNSDTILPDPGKNFRKGNLEILSTRFRPASPLMAHLSRLWPSELASGRRQQSGFGINESGGHMIFPSLEGSESNESDFGRQEIGQFSSLDRTTQVASGLLGIFGFENPGSRKESTRNPVKQRASDDMPLLISREPVIQEKPVPRHITRSAGQIAPQTLVMRRDEAVTDVPVAEPSGTNTADAESSANRSSALTPDLEDLVEKIWQRFNRKLTLEQERRGYGRWL